MVLQFRSRRVRFDDPAGQNVFYDSLLSQFAFGAIFCVCFGGGLGGSVALCPPLSSGK